MDNLKTLKSIIRGILISEPNQQLTVGGLLRRLKEEEGKTIPFLALGYSTLDEFFMSIPDTCEFSGYGNSAVLRPIINKAVCHIQAMIERQKRPKSKSRPSLRPQNLSCYSQRSSVSASSSWNPQRRPSYTANSRPVYGNYRPPERPAERPTIPSLFSLKLPSCSNQQKDISLATAAAPQSAMKQDKVFLPVTLQMKILKLVHDDPGLTIQNFKTNVNKSYPHITSIFPNIEDLVQSMESLELIGGCVYLRGEVASGGPSQASQMPLCQSDARQVYQDARPSKQIIPAGMELEDEEDEEEVLYNSFDKAVSVKVLPLKETSSQLLRDGAVWQPSLPAADTDTQRLRHDGAQENMPRPPAAPLSDGLKGRLTELLNFYPSGLWCDALPDLYKKYHRTELDFKELGFPSVLKMMMSYPDMFVCEQAEQGNWQVFNAEAYQTDDRVVFDNVLSNIKKLLAEHASGVHIDAFPDLYQNMYRRPFNYREMLFDSIDGLFISINNTHIRMKPVANRFTLYPLHKMEDDQAKVPAMDKTVFAGRIPANCVEPGHEFPKLVLPAEVAPGQFVGVILGSVASPDNFYVQIRGKGFSESLGHLADAMMAFYAENHKKYRIPLEEIVPGLICTTVTFDEYSRCIVHSEVNTENVKVIPIDFGCTLTVKKSRLLFLLKEFAKLPPQAINCRCANLVPPHNEAMFQRKAAERMLELVEDKGIGAQIAQYDKERNWLSVSLIDTSGDDDIHINDLLCKEGLAKYQLDAKLTVKTPTINSPLRLLDRLKREKMRADGKIDPGNDCSEPDLPARNVDDPAANFVDSKVVRVVAKSKRTVSEKLAALLANADTPISLNPNTVNNLNTPITESQLSANLRPGHSLVGASPGSPESIVNKISPQKSADRFVR